MRDVQEEDIRAKMRGDSKISYGVLVKSRELLGYKRTTVGMIIMVYPTLSSLEGLPFPVSRAADTRNAVGI